MPRAHSPTPEHEIRTCLRQGLSRKDILRRLSDRHERDDLLFLLNNLPEENQRRRFLFLNILLCLTLLGLTFKQLYATATLQLAARAADQFTPLLLLDLIVPMIHFYILAQLARFQRQGYQMMLILGGLALLRPENRILPDLAAYGVIISLSALLLVCLFPRSQRL